MNVTAISHGGPVRALGSVASPAPGPAPLPVDRFQSSSAQASPPPPTAPLAARPRARDLGLHIGVYPPGPQNALTDVPGVRVGHATVDRGEGPLQPGQGPARTGVTAILPTADPWTTRLPAAAFVLNGNGEATGLASVQDLGFLDTPILLTNTLNVGRVADAAVSWIVGKHPDVGITGDVPIPVVAECDDSTLNDIQGRHVGEREVLQALEGATSGPVEEGGAGAGRGMIAYGFKAGVGTASRRLPAKEGGYTVGALVVSNQGSRRDLRVDGVPVGREIPEDDITRLTEGSIIMVLATDAPLNSRQLERLARRAALGMARTGAVAHHGSGDIALAFSTRNGMPREAEGFTVPGEMFPDERLDPLYEAAVEAVEEAILNSILRARTTAGRDGNTAHEIPLDRLAEVMARYGRPLQP